MCFVTIHNFSLQSYQIVLYILIRVNTLMSMHHPYMRVLQSSPMFLTLINRRRLQQHRHMNFGIHGIQQVQHFRILTGIGGRLDIIPAEEINTKRSTLSGCLLANPAARTPPELRKQQ